MRWSPTSTASAFVSASRKEYAVRGVFPAVDDRLDRRGLQRLPVGLPASVEVGTQSFTARLANLVVGGAMLETMAPVIPGNSVTLRCGTIAAEAKIVWKKTGRIGVKFCTQLSDAEVREQISRSAALDARRASRFGNPE
jgi:hypothetical protein